MPVERRETAVFLLGYLRRHHWGLIATAISLTGTAYAATGLAPNSVGTRQIQSHAVTLSKVSLGAQRALRGRVGPVGPPGRVGPVGPRGHVGAAGPAGPSDGYYASSITGISAGPSSQPATVTVPPGQYIATGGCTASQGNGTGLNRTGFHGDWVRWVPRSLVLLVLMFVSASMSPRLRVGEAGGSRSSLDHRSCGLSGSRSERLGRWRERSGRRQRNRRRSSRRDGL